VVADEALLAAGGEMIVEVVRQRVTALTRGHDPADAHPSPRCRWCDEAPRCEPGTAWLAGPGRWRGGLPVLTAGSAFRSEPPSRVRDVDGLDGQ